MKVHFQSCFLLLLWLLAGPVALPPDRPLQARARRGLCYRSRAGKFYFLIFLFAT
jgi:hypothetical protein